MPVKVQDKVLDNEGDIMNDEALLLILKELKAINGCLSTLEQGQASLERRQISLEQGQASLKQGQASLKRE